MKKYDKIRTYVITGQVCGASHIRAGTDCQDSIGQKEPGYMNAGPALVFAVADGHGSSSCPYSKEGADTAVAVFTDIMVEFCRKYSKAKPEIFLEFLSKNREPNIMREISFEWKHKILELHVKKSNTKNEPCDEQQILRQYGTTLLGLLITPTFYFAYQLGDGDMVYINNNEISPIIEGAYLLGTETHSLCEADSWRNAATHIGMIPETKDMYAFMLATDGFSNSYADNKAFRRACRGYYAAIQEYGVKAVKKNINEWLRETSEKGSGDDISMLFIVRNAVKE